jgi:P-type Na+/K+ transporter
MVPKKGDDTEKHVSGQSNMQLSNVAHALQRDVLVKEMRTDDKDGLSEGEAKRRLEEFGRNELDNGPGVQPLKILITQGVLPRDFPTSDHSPFQLAMP